MRINIGGKKGSKENWQIKLSTSLAIVNFHINETLEENVNIEPGQVIWSPWQHASVQI